MEQIDPKNEIQFWRNKAHEYERLAQEQKKVAEDYKELYLEMKETCLDYKDTYKDIKSELLDFIWNDRDVRWNFDETHSEILNNAVNNFFDTFDCDLKEQI